MKTRSLAITALLLAAFAFAGTSCKRKEKVLDIKTPSGGIEVERDKKSGEIEMKVEEKK
jgi:hypothetical protein